LTFTIASAGVPPGVTVAVAVVVALAVGSAVALVVGSAVALVVGSAVADAKDTKIVLIDVLSAGLGSSLELTVAAVVKDGTA
jgi:hypothetical protein